MKKLSSKEVNSSGLVCLMMTCTWNSHNQFWLINYYLPTKMLTLRNKFPSKVRCCYRSFANKHWVHSLWVLFVNNLNWQYFFVITTMTITTILHFSLASALACTLKLFIIVVFKSVKEKPDGWLDVIFSPIWLAPNRQLIHMQYVI